jgi:hypothetical protein
MWPFGDPVADQTLSDLVTGGASPAKEPDKTAKEIQIPVHDADGTPSIVRVPAGTPKAQIHAVMRENNLTHYTPPAEQSGDTGSQDQRPGWLGSTWEAIKDEALSPMWEAAKHQVAELGPNALAERHARIQQAGGGVRGYGGEVLRAIGDVGALTTPIYAPAALGAQVAAHDITRSAGASRGAAQTVGTLAGLAEPAGEVMLAGRNVPGQLTRLGHEATGEYQAARNATSQVLNDVITEADNRGITLNPTQRHALASEIDDLYPTKGQIPTIDRIETHLLDPNRDVTMSDLDRYHTEVRKRLPLSPTYNQAQDQALQQTIRKAQEDALQPHADLHAAWTDALDQWGQQIAPSQRLLAKVGRNRTTIESPATSREFEAQQRAPGGELGVPAVNERLRQARDLVRAQQRSAGPAMTVAAPLIGAALGGGAAGGSAFSSGQHDPATLAATVIPAAIASAIATQGLRTGRVGMATPAGQAAALRYLALGPAVAGRMTSR